MALPQDGQNANGLTKVTEIPKGKELIFIDPTTNEGGIITLEDLTTQILKNLTSQTFALDQGNMTLLAALNQLNSNAFLPKAELRTNVDSAEPGAYRVVDEYPVDGEKEAVLLCFKIFNNDWGLLTQFLIPKDSSYIKVRTCWYKTWENWKKYNADS